MLIGKMKLLNNPIDYSCFSFSVDYDKYPSLNNNNIHYYQVNLSKGDCLFLPALWIHQVRSTNRNIAVNYWLNHERVTNAIVNRNTCLLIQKSNFTTLDTIQWPNESSNIEYLKKFMLDLVEENERNFKDWTREFSKVNQKCFIRSLLFFSRNSILSFNRMLKQSHSLQK